jgi:hypothetical protein
MPSLVVTANTAAQTVFTASNTRIVKLKRIDIDHHGVNAVTLTIQDTFTPSASNAVPIVLAATTETRFVVSAVPGVHYEITDGVSGLRFLGLCEVDSTAIDADCDITVIWE